MHDQENAVAVNTNHPVAGEGRKPDAEYEITLMKCFASGFYFFLRNFPFVLTSQSAGHPFQIRILLIVIRFWVRLLMKLITKKHPNCVRCALLSLFPGNPASGTFHNNTDNILISFFVGTVFVGYYSNYAMMIAAVVSIISLIFNAVKAGIGNLMAGNDCSHREKLFLFNVLELINYWMVGFCAICFICLLSDFITICFGPEYELDFGVVAVTVINFYVNNIRQNMWAFRETTGLFHETRFITTVTAALNIIFSLLMGYIWGMTGIITATIIVRMAYAWWKEPMILYDKCFGTSPGIYYITYLKRGGLCVGVGLITYTICDLVQIKDPYIRFGINIIVCLIVPNIIFFICFWKTPEFHYVWEKLISPVFGRFFTAGK